MIGLSSCCRSSCMQHHSVRFATEIDLRSASTKHAAWHSDSSSARTWFGRQLYCPNMEKGCTNFLGASYTKSALNHTSASSNLCIANPFDPRELLSLTSTISKKPIPQATRGKDRELPTDWPLPNRWPRKQPLHPLTEESRGHTFPFSCLPCFRHTHTLLKKVRHAGRRRQGF